MPGLGSDEPDVARAAGVRQRLFLDAADVHVQFETVWLESLGIEGGDAHREIGVA